MNRILLLVIAFLAFNHFLWAQSTPAIAPDFTVEDLNGETHNLYEILGSGKTVVLDFYTTWCPPCWNYHNGRELHKLWERHGPDGLDDYVIIAIESDGFTNLADIMGTGDNTLGDWTEDVGYPMVDNNQIQHLFNIVGYPTYLQICTDRTIIEMQRDFQNPNSPTVMDYETEKLNCSIPESANNVTAYAYDSYEDDICDATIFQPSVDIRNSGSDKLTSCNAQLYVDNILKEEIVWNGELNTYQHASIPFSEITIDDKTKLEIKLSEPNGASDDDLSDNGIVKQLKVAKTAASTELLLEIRTDARGSETYWAILDKNEEIVAEGGNPLVGFDNTGNINSTAPDHPSAYGGDETILETIKLTNNGCYTLVVTDYSSNGICCGYLGVGRYVLKDETGFILAVGGEFQEKVRHNFRFEGGVTSTNNNSLNADINVWPNPVHDKLNIDFELNASAEATVQLSDVYGNELKTSSEFIQTGKQFLSYDLSVYPAGIYFVSVITEGSIVSKKIIKN